MGYGPRRGRRGPKPPPRGGGGRRPVGRGPGRGRSSKPSSGGRGRRGPKPGPPPRGAGGSRRGGPRRGGKGGRRRGPKGPSSSSRSSRSHSGAGRPRGPGAGRQVPVVRGPRACSGASRCQARLAAMARAISAARASSVRSPSAAARASPISARRRRRSSASMVAGVRGGGRFERGVKSMIRAFPRRKSLARVPVAGRPRAATHLRAETLRVRATRSENRLGRGVAARPLCGSRRPGRHHGPLRRSRPKASIVDAPCETFHVPSPRAGWPWKRASGAYVPLGLYGDHRR